MIGILIIVIFCTSYIYPILDWEDHPGMATGVVLGGCVLMPVIQVGFNMIKTSMVIIFKNKAKIIIH